MIKKNYFSEDIFELLLLLNKHGVKYLIVGGEAAIYYGHTRLTAAYYVTMLALIVELKK